MTCKSLSIINISVGRQLKIARKSKGLSQAELGNLLTDKSSHGLLRNTNSFTSTEALERKKRTHQQLISQYEKGAARIPCENLYLLSVILEVNTDYFFLLYQKLSTIKKDLKSLGLASLDLNSVDMASALLN